MAASAFDSHILHRLFPTGDVGRLFTDTAEVRAMLIVEGALAKVQGAAGVIPETSAAFIQRSAMEVQIDPAGLADETGTNGVSVPALVAAFRKVMEAPEHAQYLHWGATSQDIIDTALMLRLKQAFSIYEELLRSILSAMADLAETHATTPVAARTFGQIADPTSFGAQVAAWGHPLLKLLQELPALRESVLWVSLAGAAGTASQLGDDPAALRSELAKVLKLNDPGRNWHTDRTPILSLTHWITRALAALGKVGEDMTLACQSGIVELRLGGTGASSTMPQKQNPIGPASLISLHTHGTALASSLTQSAAHRQARDGAAWFTEWLALPQLCLSVAATFNVTLPLIQNLTIDVDQMRRSVTGNQGLIFSEALSFALTKTMSRPDAQAAVKDLVSSMQSSDDLPTVAREKWPDLPKDLFSADAALGTAPTEARHFAKAVRNV